MPPLRQVVEALSQDLVYCGGTIGMLDTAQTLGSARCLGLGGGGGRRLGLLAGGFAPVRLERGRGLKHWGNHPLRLPCWLWNAVNAVSPLGQADEEVLGAERLSLGGA